MDITYNIPAYSGETQLITLAAAKKQLRIEHDYEDTEIQGFIDAAIAEAESYLGKLLQPRDMVFGLPAWQTNTTFPIGPVTAVTSVDYLADGDEDTTNLATTGYKLYNFSGNKDVILIKEAIHSTTLEQETLDAVQITATVGYADGTVPKDIINAILLLITDKYEFRGEKETKQNRSSRNLLRPYKQWV
tara:strand:- start:191 stop:757 length:567 start_codon:yes stop_codon:yes gene_type:complete